MKYLFQEEHITKLLMTHKLVVIDGGARGRLFPPFDKVNTDVLQVIRFEPDQNAIVNGRATDVVVPKALWSSRKVIDLCVAEDGSTSSAFPFNIPLQKCIDPLMSSRKLKEIVQVEAISLDDILQEYHLASIDFIKLDVHGSEFEILEGGPEAIKTALGMLIESWVLPIHAGQKLRAQVESFACGQNFYVFEECKRAVWARKAVSNVPKKQVVALDTLFFKDPILDDSVTDEVSAIKLIGMADLFQHQAYAAQLTNHFAEREVLSKKYHSYISDFIQSSYKKSLSKIVSAFVLDALSNKINRCAFR